ncbi:arginine--tRNA ligase [Rhodohalobacter sulfatireducens]|uniref:Arginine--tRNA ligase n=1 Tax=Rhodohalobacter sulfatireducens TaxID=2911366 RepID=A0ABS9K8A6_9BACT|nr:arginine--tRNA ligase [Rhodohalobacter sulfatireducens]MCG2587089.1 arginine--tRNA ligase [Rhodohalobacter sulfatireducens]
METYLQKIISQALLKLGLSEEQLPDIKIETPKDPTHGDAATNVAMVLPKILKKNPRAIAEELISHLESDPKKIKAIEIAGPGFINFRFAEDYLYDELAEILNSGTEFGKTTDNQGIKCLVEFVSANPTGPLTVGHGRNAVLGDTVSRLLEWTGADVQREYYFNNAGRQMRMLGLSVQARYLEELKLDSEFPEGGYEGGYIKDIAKQLLEEHGDKLADKEDVTLFKEKAETVIFEEIQNTLGRMNIEMDSFFNEHTLYEDGSIDQVVQTFREKELAYDKDGAVWFKTTEFGKDQDTVLIKSSGEPTYRLPDIAYHANKLDRGFDLCIDVFGADHIDTYPDVLSGIDVLGYDKEKVEVLVYQFVTLVKDGKPFKMSTRKANFVTLDELMDEVGEDVTRFFFLMRSPNTHLEFDITTAKETGEKNPVFYLQYAHARIQSILRKIDEIAEFIDDIDLSVLTHESEITLIKKLIAFPEAISLAAQHREPHRLITYLNELASSFTSFYHDCRIIGEVEEIMQARTGLAKASATVLANGLGILGIEAPDRM